MVLNGSGVRDTARVLGVNRNTVSNQFKKSVEVIHVNPVYVNKGLKLPLKLMKCVLMGSIKSTNAGCDRRGWCLRFWSSFSLNLSSVNYPVKASPNSDSQMDY